MFRSNYVIARGKPNRSAELRNETAKAESPVRADTPASWPARAAAARGTSRVMFRQGLTLDDLLGQAEGARVVEAGDGIAGEVQGAESDGVPGNAWWLCRLSWRHGGRSLLTLIEATKPAASREVAS